MTGPDYAGNSNSCLSLVSGYALSYVRVSSNEPIEDHLRRRHEIEAEIRSLDNRSASPSSGKTKFCVSTRQILLNHVSRGQGVEIYVTAYALLSVYTATNRKPLQDVLRLAPKGVHQNF